MKLRRRFYGKRRSSPINLEEILGGNSDRRFYSDEGIIY
jgi:hypothetical protein